MWRGRWLDACPLQGSLPTWLGFELIRVVFGRSFAGLLVFLIGLGLFILWIFLALLSFFFFFIPALHGFFYLTLGILLVSLVFIAAGALTMVLGAKIPSGPRRVEAWSRGWARRQVRTDQLESSEKVGDLFAAVLMLLILAFFVQNQIRNTGFFTERFGVLEQVLFYGPGLISVLVSLSRAAYGRRNALRPYEAMNFLFVSVASFWLLSIFPFSFNQLDALFPLSVRPFFFWSNNTVGALLILLAGIAGLVSALYKLIVYSIVRAENAPYRYP